MKTTEIRELSAAELDTKLADLKEQLFNLRFQMATGQCENPMKIRIRSLKNNLYIAEFKRKARVLRDSEGDEFLYSYDTIVLAKHGDRNIAD